MSHNLSKLLVFSYFVQFYFNLHKFSHKNDFLVAIWICFECFQFNFNTILISVNMSRSWAGTWVCFMGFQLFWDKILRVVVALEYFTINLLEIVEFFAVFVTWSFCLWIYGNIKVLSHFRLDYGELTSKSAGTLKALNQKCFSKK